MNCKFTLHCVEALKCWISGVPAPQAPLEGKPPDRPQPRAVLAARSSGVWANEPDPGTRRRMARRIARRLRELGILRNPGRTRTGTVP